MSDRDTPLPITYNYLCPCGHYETEQETLLPDAVSRWPDKQHKEPYVVRLYRPVIEPVLTCPSCGKQVTPTVVVTYTTTQTTNTGVTVDWK